MEDQRLLVVGSGRQVFREYGLAAMSRRARLLLVAGDDLTWQEPYVAEYRKVDCYDAASLLAAARELRPDGVVTYDETLVERVADLAAALGLPYTDPEAVRTCKDKKAFRDRLERAGIGEVGYAVVHTAPDALAAANRIGYPVVLKPRALQSSVGVVRADDDGQLAAAFPKVTEATFGGIGSTRPGVVVEEFLDGPEFSVDCVTWRGETRPLVLAEKRLGFAPYFEEVGHVVPARPRPELAAALTLVEQAHRVVGLDRLVTHSEFRLTSKGPRLIEINTRLGGDLIPYLGLLATGVDVAGAAADMALDREPDLGTTHERVAAVTMIHPPHHLRLADVRLRTERHPGLDLFAVIAAPGSEVYLPPRSFLCRLALAVVTGRDHAECDERRRAVEADVVISGEPLP
jgi:biotin carboxylase